MKLRHTILSIALTTISLAIAGVAWADFGKTSGVFDVSPQGAATYKIPLWTPPGPGGVEPELRLEYDSQLTGGLAGVGWTLNAVSSIDRCEKTIMQDGAFGEVSMTNTDKYCLRGNRLRRMSGIYGAVGSTYQTEIEEFSKVTAFGVAGSGPAYFTVQGKNGWLCREPPIARCDDGVIS